MSTAGPKIAGTGADDGGANVVWSNPGNITANDGTLATVALAINTSNELLATNFGFAIPNGATVLGIQVDISRQKA